MILVKLFVKDYKNVKNEIVRENYGLLAGTVGIILNLLLFTIKMVAGILTSAISITADAFNNLSDAGSSIITLVGFKAASKKGDKEHPFGHGRLEYVSGLVIAFIIITVSIEFLRTSVNKIINPTEVKFNSVSAIILVVSILVKIWMGFFNKKLSKAINSSALKATCIDSFSDTATTSVVLAGLIIGYFSGFNPDGYLGALVAGFILYEGIMATRDTLRPLLGTTPDPEFVQNIRDTVLSHEEITGVHDLIVHDYGPSRLMISLHAEVPCDCNVVHIHDVIDMIEMELREKFGCDVTIHMDPIASNDEFTAQLRETIIQVVASVDESLSIHDFRITNGPYHTNIIFDVVIPYKSKITDEQLVQTLKDCIHELNENYFAVIQVDKDYN